MPADMPAAMPAAADTQASFDRLASAIFLAANALLSPAQAYLFAPIWGVSVGTIFERTMRDRCGQSLVLVMMIIVPGQPWYMRNRTKILSVSYAALWIMHVDSNSRLLALADSMDNPFATRLIVALMVPMALAMHVALPLVPSRIAPDIIAYVLAVLTQAVCAPLPRNEAVRFGACLVVLLALPVALRVTRWHIEARAPRGNNGKDVAAPARQPVDPTDGGIDERDFAASRKLIHIFCSVQIVLGAAIIAVFPRTLPVMGTSTCILILLMVAREAVEEVDDWRRAQSLLGWAWCAIMSGWLPTQLANRYGFFELTVPAYVMCLSAAMWTHFTLYQHLVGIPPKQRFLSDATAILAFSLQPAYSPLSQPAEGLLVACAVLVGELAGFAWANNQRQFRAVVEQKALRVINHSAKRVMSNTAQARPITPHRTDHAPTYA